MNRILTGVIIILGLSIALNIALPVRALEADYEVKPSRVDLMIKPGQKVQMTFKVTNYGDPQTFTPKIMNAAPDSGTGTLALSKTVKTPMSFTFRNGRHDAGEPIFLKANESADVPVALDAGSGEQKDYYFYFLTEAQSAASLEGKTSVQLQPRIGVPLVITLTNIAEREIKSEISVLKVSPTYSFRLFGREINLVETGSKAPVTLMVSNTGSNFISPEGKISMRGSFGVSAEYPFIKRNIYAQSGRLMLTKSSLESPCPNKNECKRYTAVIDGLLFGRYTVAASVDGGTDAAKSYKSTTFIAFPFKPVFFILLFIGIYTLLMRKREPRQKKKP